MMSNSSQSGTDFFEDLFDFHFEAIVLIALIGLILVALVPLSLWIISYEDQVNRTQTLITRINTGTLF